MASTTCELVMLKQLLHDFDITHDTPALFSMIILLLFAYQLFQHFMSKPNILRLIVIIYVTRCLDNTVKLMPIHTHLQLADMSIKPLSQ